MMNWPDDPGFRERDRIAREERRRMRRIRKWQQNFDRLMAEAHELGIAPNVAVYRHSHAGPIGPGTNDRVRQDVPYVDRES